MRNNIKDSHYIMKGLIYILFILIIIIYYDIFGI